MIFLLLLQHTLDHPLCYDMVAIHPKKALIEHRSGPVYEILGYLEQLGMSGTIEQFFTTETKIE
ncbi:unnamed protein product, partial [Gongylonema pulchrum]|uniref:Transposase n=1 Tax=Gongylonema pulchrum TaxID=637853 RepID=A0A183DIM9_9BILA